MTTYLVTTCVFKRIWVFDEPQHRMLVQQCLDEKIKHLGVRMLAYVIMPDHCHFIIDAESRRQLGRIMQHLKGYSGHVFTQRHPGLLTQHHNLVLGTTADGAEGVSRDRLWSRRYHGVELPGVNAVERAIEYVKQNPKKAKLAPDEYHLYVGADKPHGLAVGFIGVGGTAADAVGFVEQVGMGGTALGAAGVFEHAGAESDAVGAVGFAEYVVVGSAPVGAVGIHDEPMKLKADKPHGKTMGFVEGEEVHGAVANTVLRRSAYANVSPDTNPTAETVGLGSGDALASAAGFMRGFAEQVGMGGARVGAVGIHDEPMKLKADKPHGLAVGFKRMGSAAVDAVGFIGVGGAAANAVGIL